MSTSLNAAGRGGVRRGLAAVAAVLLAVVAALGLIAGPAAAHSGGKAIVLVQALDIAPASGSWQATAILADYDGGGPLRAVDVQIMGAGLTKMTQMTETSTPGTYRIALPKAAPGAVDITMKVVTAPGGTAVTPYDNSFKGTLVDGQSLNLATGKVAAGGGGGGSNTGMIVGVAGAVLLVAVLYGLFAMRKRTAVPARAK